MPSCSGPEVTEYLLTEVAEALTLCNAVGLGVKVFSSRWLPRTSWRARRGAKDVMPTKGYINTNAGNQILKSAIPEIQISKLKVSKDCRSGNE